MYENEFPERFKTYVSHRITDAVEINVQFIEPIYGGASQQTYRIGLSYKTPLNEMISQRVILKREFESGLIDTDSYHEFIAFQEFYNTNIPVPRPIWHEKDIKWLGRPFMIVEEIADSEVDNRLLGTDPYNLVKEKVGETFCRIMGNLAGADTRGMRLYEKLEAVPPDQCWKKELDYWESVIDQNETQHHPLLRAAIRKLRRNPPPPAQKIAVVHGDFRPGNFMFDKEGNITAILDWEMIHLGDPLEDLSWSLNMIYSSGDPGMLGNMIPRDRAIKIWEEASGLSVDTEALKWWEIFTSVKGLGIWITSANIFSKKENMEPIIAYAAILGGAMDSLFLLQKVRGA